MLRLVAAASLLASGGAQTDAHLGQRAYEALQKQDLVTLGSVLGVLLLLMIFMAVCVYKPLPRR